MPATFGIAASLTAEFGPARITLAVGDPVPGWFDGIVWRKPTSIERDGWKFMSEGWSERWQHGRRLDQVAA